MNENLHVLLVEDDPDDRSLTIGALGRSNGLGVARVSCAANLEDAVRIIEEAGHPDLVLLDLMLPGSKGRGTYERMRAATPSPIMILSGMEDEEMAVELVQSGAQDFLLKDEITPRSLARAIRYALERHRTRMELERNNRLLHDTREHLIDVAKFESVGHIAAEIAHEVKNPLAIIQLSVELLGAQADDIPVALLPEIGRIQRCVDRASTIINQLLGYSVTRESTGQVCDLGGIGSECGTLFARMFQSRGVRFSTSCAEGVRAFGDPLRIQQIVVNFLENSLDALMREGEIQLSTGFADAAASGPWPAANSNRMPTDKRMVFLEVRDNGPGLASALVPRVFEAYFSTKARSRGTGLGLYVSSLIAHMHYGLLRFESSDDPADHGSRVRLLLPAHTEPDGG